MCSSDIPIVGDIIEAVSGGGGSSGMQNPSGYNNPYIKPIVQPPIIQPIIDSNPVSQIEQAVEEAGPVLGEIIEEPFEQALDITGGLIGGTLGASAGVLGAAFEQGLGDLGNFFYQAQNTLLTSGQGANRQGQASRPSTTGSRNILGL